jgi:hypothetical protein
MTLKTCSESRHIVHTFYGFVFTTNERLTWKISTNDRREFICYSQDFELEKKATEIDKLCITNYNKLYKNSSEPSACIQKVLMYLLYETVTLKGLD